MNATKILEDLREVDLFNVDSDYYGSHPHYIKQLENLIHQQADRIAELEKGIQGTVGYHCYQAGLQESADRIAELEKQLNLHKNAHHKCVEILQEKQSEPYAWYYFGEIWFQNSKEEMLSWHESYKDEYPDSKILPLYTTPQTKPAPDGCIDPKSYYIGYEDGKKAPQTKPLSDEEILEIAGKYWVNRLHYALYFARAIEAKVRGEK